MALFSTTTIFRWLLITWYQPRPSTELLDHIFLLLITHFHLNELPSQYDLLLREPKAFFCILKWHCRQNLDYNPWLTFLLHLLSNSLSNSVTSAYYRYDSLSTIFTLLLPWASLGPRHFFLDFGRRPLTDTITTVSHYPQTILNSATRIIFQKQL